MKQALSSCPSKKECRRHWTRPAARGAAGNFQIGPGHSMHTVAQLRWPRDSQSSLVLSHAVAHFGWPGIFQGGPPGYLQGGPTRVAHNSKSGRDICKVAHVGQSQISGVARIKFKVARNIRKVAHFRVAQNFRSGPGKVQSGPEMSESGPEIGKVARFGQKCPNFGPLSWP